MNKPHIAKNPRYDDPHIHTSVRPLSPASRQLSESGCFTARAQSVQAASDAYATDATSGLFSHQLHGTARPTPHDRAARRRLRAATVLILRHGKRRVPRLSAMIFRVFTFAGLNFLSGASAFTIGGNAFHADDRYQQSEHERGDVHRPDHHRPQRKTLTTVAGGSIVLAGKPYLRQCPRLDAGRRGHGGGVGLQQRLQRHVFPWVPPRCCSWTTPRPTRPARPPA